MALIYDPTKHRPVKIIMRVDLLREADKSVMEQLGGHEDRHELFNEAVQQYLVELRTGPDAEEADTSTTPASSDRTEPGTDTSTSLKSTANEARGPATVSVPDVEPITNLADTAIQLPEKKPVIVAETDAVPRREPLLGLHNSDIPSIDALAYLAEETADGPLPVKTFYEQATQRARELAVALVPYEARHKVKLSALLPSNLAKAQAAARGYQTFALGHINREPRDDGKLDCWGPLYQWGVAGLVRDGKETKIGITNGGWELLQELEGVSLGRPHTPDHARRFLHFLQAHAPEDLWGFGFLLQAVGEGVGRVDLNARFLAARDWKESVATSVAQGYLARSREWGLVTPKLIEGRYQLTTFGREMRNALAAGKDTGDEAKQTNKRKGRRGRRAG
jgi:hypothetical protein